VTLRTTAFNGSAKTVEAEHTSVISKIIRQGYKRRRRGILVAAAVRPWIKFRMKFEARKAGIQAANSSTDAAPSALNQILFQLATA
jgi:hypothetical protein